MSAIFRAGAGLSLSSHGHTIVAVDLGFAQSGKTTGFAWIDRVGQIWSESLDFRGAVARVKDLFGEQRGVLIIEAPLSAAFGKTGPMPRGTFEQAEQGNRYWYCGSGASTSLSALYFLNELSQLLGPENAAIELYEGFVSYKNQGKGSDKRIDHWLDAEDLIRAAIDPTMRESCVFAPGVQHSISILRFLAEDHHGIPEIIKPRRDHLVFLGGLPGSGKSFRLEKYRKAHWQVYDDFQAGAQNDSSEFSQAKDFDGLVADLQGGKRCVVADIQFVDEGYRRSATKALGNAVDDFVWRLELFANEPERCAENVRLAERKEERRASARLSAIAQFTKRYSMPEHGFLLPVWGENRTSAGS